MLEHPLPVTTRRFRRSVLVATRDARGEESTLFDAEREGGDRCPQIELIEARPPEEEALLPPAVFPFGGSIREPSVHPDVLPTFVDPSAQPIPGTQERFVRDLNGRFSGRGVAIERQEAVTSVGVQGRLHRTRIDLDRGQLGEPDAAPRVGGSLSEGHEPQEELLNGVSPGGLSSRVEVLRGRGQRPADASDVSVRVESDTPVLAPVVELGERVLDER